MADKLRFRIRLPWAETKIVPFQGSEMWFGRDPDCSFVIDDPEVSRRHALFATDSMGKVTVTDLASTNGTYVRGAPITDETVITPGVSVRIGETVITLELTGSKNMETYSALTTDAIKYDVNAQISAPKDENLVLSWNVLEFQRDIFESASQVNFLELILMRIKSIVKSDNGYLILSREIAGYENPAMIIGKGQKLMLPSNIIDEISSSQNAIMAPSRDGKLNESFQGAQISSYMCVPIRENTSNWGVLYIDRSSSQPIFTENDMRILIQITRLLAFTLRQESKSLTLSVECDNLRAERERWNRLNVSASDVPVKSQNRKYQQLLFKILRVAGTQHPILLYGSPGSGRSNLARRIHATSSRKENCFVEVDCSSIPLSLLEEELFGLDPIPGQPAAEVKRGFIELADKGTLYLRDISSIPIFVQKKLADLLTTGKIKHKGGEHTINADVRFIASIDVELSKMLTANTILGELHEMLAPLTIEVPPLKQRPEDVIQLAKFFLRQYIPSNRPLSEFSSEVTSILNRYSWPGNIRELSQVMRVVAAICHDDRIELGDLPRYLLEQAVTPFDPKTPLRDQIDRLEAEIIRTALERNRNIVTRAAKELGLSESTLRYRMQRLNIQ